MRHHKVRGFALAAPLLLAAAAFAPIAVAGSQEDAAAESKIKSALTAEPNYYFKHVDVTVKDGVAHLRGSVGTADAMARAKQIARDAPGVTRVENDMKVERAEEHGPH
jgi:osmotically-inducible protein OsmY